LTKVINFLGLIFISTQWRTLNSLKDSNVSPTKKQWKKKELGHVP